MNAISLIDKLNSYIPTTESEEPLKYTHNDFGVIELFSDGLYSLMIIYKDNIIFSRATFRRKGCVSYKNKRQIYINDLSLELIKLNIV